MPRPELVQFREDDPDPREERGPWPWWLVVLACLYIGGVVAFVMWLVR